MGTEPHLCSLVLRDPGPLQSVSKAERPPLKPVLTEILDYMRRVKRENMTISFFIFH